MQNSLTHSIALGGESYHTDLILVPSLITHQCEKFFRDPISNPQHRHLKPAEGTIVPFQVII